MNSILRKRFFQTQIYLGILLFALGLAFFPREASLAAVQGIELCASVLVPSLFPFFVVSSMCMRTGLAARAGRLFEKPMRLLFRLPGACASAFALGLAGGYPVGASSAASLFRQGLCTRRQAERLLGFCNNCGPGFIFGAVGSAMLGSRALGALLYLSHVGASVCTGLVLSLPSRRLAPPERASRAPAAEPMPFARAFTESVTASFSSVLNVSAFVIFFAVFTRLSALSGLSGALGSLLPGRLPSGMAAALTNGFFEVTGGVQSLASLSCPLSLKLTACAFLLGWGGLSVHGQTLSLTEPAGLSPRFYFAGKALHAAFSALFAAAALHFFPSAAPVFFSFSPALPPETPRLLSSLAFSLRASFACLGIFAALSLLSRIISHCKKNKKTV